MCDWKPGPRCAGDTRGVCAKHRAEYESAFPDGPALNPLAAAEAAYGPADVPPAPVENVRALSEAFGWGGDEQGENLPAEMVAKAIEAGADPDQFANMSQAEFNEFHDRHIKPLLAQVETYTAVEVPAEGGHGVLAGSDVDDAADMLGAPQMVGVLQSNYASSDRGTYRDGQFTGTHVANIHDQVYAPAIDRIAKDYAPVNLPAPVDMPGEQMIQSLWSKNDPLGLGVDATAESRGVLVYYSEDGAEPIGVHQTPTGNVEILRYGADDADFEYPYRDPMYPGPISPVTARIAVSGHLGVSENTSALTARASQASGGERSRLAARFRELNEGARAEVRNSAFSTYHQGLANDSITGHNNIESGQIDRAYSAGGGRDNATAATAVHDAAWALTHRDHIGARGWVVEHHDIDGKVWRTEGWTQEAYDRMTRPVREVFGPIHPADDDLPTLTLAD